MTRTVGEEWSRQWRQVIRDEIFKNQEQQGNAFVFANMFGGNNFWHTPTKDTWHKIMGNKYIMDNYLEFSDAKFQEHQDHIVLNKPVLLPDQIPIPRSRKAKPVQETRQLPVQQTQQENTQYLLEQVLDRLDSMAV